MMTDRFRMHDKCNVWTNGVTQSCQKIHKNGVKSIFTRQILREIRFPSKTDSRTVDETGKKAKGPLNEVLVLSNRKKTLLKRREKKRMN